MRRSKIVAPIHIVWATRDRLPLITSEIEERVYRCICQEAEKMGAEIIAIGGMPDHVHLAVQFPATISFSDFVKQIKGASSNFVKKSLLPPDSFFYWQEGYGLFAFQRNMIPTVVAYIQNQKTHHAKSTVSPALEATYEEVSPQNPVREDGTAKP
jgi:putative transposase